MALITSGAAVFDGLLLSAKRYMACGAPACASRHDRIMAKHDHADDLLLADEPGVSGSSTLAVCFVVAYAWVMMAQSLDLRVCFTTLHTKAAGLRPRVKLEAEFASA